MATPDAPFTHYEYKRSADSGARSRPTTESGAAHERPRRRVPAPPRARGERVTLRKGDLVSRVRTAPVHPALLALLSSTSRHFKAPELVEAQCAPRTKRPTSPTTPGVVPRPVRDPVSLPRLRRGRERLAARNGPLLTRPAASRSDNFVLSARRRPLTWLHPLAHDFFLSPLGTCPEVELRTALAAHIRTIYRAC